MSQSTSTTPTQTPLAPVILGSPISPHTRQVSDPDRTAVPTPVDSRSVHEQSTSTGTSQNSESEGTRAPSSTDSPELKAKDEKRHNSENDGEGEKGKKDEWSYDDQLKVIRISFLIFTVPC